MVPSRPRPSTRLCPSTQSDPMQSGPSTWRTVLIGPCAERYRGGIAQFTSRFAEELSRSSQLRFISWEKLYPKSIVEREHPQRHQGMHSFSVPGEAILSVSNMRSWKVAAQTIAAYRPDKIFFTWSHPVHALVYGYLVRKLAATTSAELIGVCHNVLPHEAFPGAKSLTRLALGKLDRLVVHGPSEEALAKELFPELPVSSTFVPLFDFLVTTNGKRTIGDNPFSEIRRPRNILYFGAIRKYKGVDVLLRAMPRVLAQMPNVRLKIIGEQFFQSSSMLGRLLAETESPFELVEKLGLSRVVSFQNRYVPDNEISALFDDVDLAVLPFRSPSLSASLLLAYAHGVPVVASRNGGFVDTVIPGVTGYFAEPDDPTSLAASIVHLLRNPIPSEKIYNATRNLTWANYTRAMLGTTMDQQSADPMPSSDLLRAANEAR